MANRNESPSQEPSIEEQPQPQPQGHCKENGYVNTVHETIELQDDPRKWSPMRKLKKQDKCLSYRSQGSDITKEGR
ncbi:hypothetical protein APSETT444_004231 [Aspergillus pseudonomiae]